MHEFDAQKHDVTNDEVNAGSIRDDRSEGCSEDKDTTCDAELYGQNYAAQSSAGYTFIENGSPEGRGYTTPEGGHGFVYSPPTVPKGNGVGRKLIIAMSVIGTVILLMGCSFLGGWAATRTGNAYAADDPSQENEGESQDIPGTAGGFIIVDETEPGETTSPSAEGTEAVGDHGAVTSDNENNQFSEDRDPPAEATIEKKPAEREDLNNDGRADVAYDADGQVITSAGDSQMTVSTVVAAVSSSVVEISTETLVQSDWIGQYVTGGAGSGVIIAEEGYIITNHHVIDGADSILVRLNDGTSFNATLIGTDESTDVAILWIDAGDYPLTAATLGSSYDLVAGEDVIAIGNPLGSLGGTVTEGIISATARQISVDGNDMTLLQVSAPINPGNSGGGLFNMAGELVGVVNAKMSSEEIEGLGFAIPVDTAYRIACELIEYRYVRGRVTTGLKLVNADSLQTAMYYFNSRYTGVYVYESVSDVLQYGDLLLSVNGTEIAQSTDISKAINGLSVGDQVEFVIYRTKTKEQLTVTLELMEYVPDYLQEDVPSLNPAA